MATLESSQGGARNKSPSLVTILHYVVLGLLVIAGAAYWALRPSSINPMADPRAAEAMALVQTHPAHGAPTILQAVNNRVKRLADRGQGVRLDAWRVQQEAPDVYLVKVIIREEGTKQWFEREYLWRVNLKRRAVEAISMPAGDLMPLTPEASPAPGPPGQTATAGKP
ncbi:hypothetical protein [Nitrospira sp. Kam-Ns4a]